MPEKKEFWAILDLFGHSKIAGFLTEDQIGGSSMIRIDVPSVDGMVGYTKWFGPGAIYSISPTDEKIVRAFIARFKPSPITVYMPEIKQLEYNESGIGLDRDRFMEDPDEDDQ